MAFKVVSGGNQFIRIAKLWKQSFPSHESSLEALNRHNWFKGLYKNRMVNSTNWKKVQPSQVKL